VCVCICVRVCVCVLRFPYFTAGDDSDARHPRSACSSQHAVHPSDGATVRTQPFIHTVKQLERVPPSPRNLLPSALPSSSSTNTERTCYTGALCGLGWDSSTLEPLLPERDMELAFDTHFDVEDIIGVTLSFFFFVAPSLTQCSPSFASSAN